MLSILIQAYFAYGIILTGTGNYNAAFSTMCEGLDIAEKVGEKVYHFRLLNALGWLYTECGDLTNALEYNHRSAELAGTIDDPEIIANAELNLADTFLIQEDFSQSRKYLDKVFRITNDPTTSDWMKWRYRIHLFASFAEFWLANGNLSKAEEFAQQCLTEAKKTASLKYLVKGMRVMGEIGFARGELDISQVWLQQAVSAARTLGNPTQLYKAYHAMGMLQEKARNTELTQNAYQSALQVVNNVRNNLHDSDLGGSFENLPLVEQVVDAGSRI